MLEAKLPQALTLKQLIEAVKELVTDANFEVDEDGLKLQAMDNSHVALVALLLKTSGFEQFRCDRNMALGVNVASLQKIVKCAGNDDLVTLRAQEDADVLNLVFETKNTDRVAEYEMKLMDIDTEHLGIPDTVYDAEISLPAPEFTRIVRDLKELGESVRIEATKEGVKFSAEGDIGTANVTLKQTADSGQGVAMDDDDNPEASEDEDDDEEDGEEEEEDEEKDEEKGKEDGDRMDEEKPAMIDSDDEPPKSKKRKSEGKPKTNGKRVKKEKSAKKGGTAGKKSKGKGKNTEDDGDEARKVSISLQQSVSLTFSIKYLANFTKAAPLAKYVRLHMSNEVPLLVEYDFGFGHVRYYLAPKISDE